MKKCLLLVLLSLLFGVAHAQQLLLKGKVTDAKTTSGIPGANILIEKTGAGAATDPQGNFELKLKNDFPLEVSVSAIGYETQKVELLSSEALNKPLNISLSEQAIDLSNIVISASRQVESIEEAPGAISVIGAKELAEQSAITTDLAGIITQAVPGLGFSTNTTSNTGQTLRGRNMLVLIDGIPQSTPLRNGSRDIRTIDPSVIERIEVIKGATAIYGNGADGGLINYITRKPTGKELLNSSTQLSSATSVVDPSGAFSGKLAQQFYGKNGKFSYTFNGSYEKTGVYRDAEGDVLSPQYGLGETDLYNLFGKARYQLTEDQDIELMYNFFSSKQDTKYSVENGVYGKEKTRAVEGEAPGVPQGTRSNHNAYLHYNNAHLVGNTSLQANLYFQDFETVYSFSEYFENGGQSAIQSNKKGLRLNLNTPFRFSEAFKGNLTYGLDILNDVTSQRLVDGRIWVPEVSMTNLAPYAQMKAYVLKDVVLKAGARFENIGLDIPDYTTIKTLNYATGNYEVGGVAVEGGQLKYNAFVYNAGLRYIGADLFSPFVSFSQGFSVTDLGRLLRSATSNTVSKLNTEAVIVNNYEAGFSSKFSIFYLQASAYLSTSELGSSFKEVNGVYQIMRAPERVYGYEVALDATLIPGNLTAGGSYSYTEGMADSNEDGVYNEEDVYLPGNRIAPSKLTAFVNYTPWKQSSIKLQTLTSGARDRFEPNEAGAYGYGLGPVTGFTVVNLYASHRFSEHMRLQVGVENLLNKDYFTTVSQWYGRNDYYVKGNGARATVTLQFDL